MVRYVIITLMLNVILISEYHQQYQNRNAPSAHQQPIRSPGRRRGGNGVPPPNYQQNSANNAQMAAQQQSRINIIPGNNSQEGGGEQSRGSPANNPNHGTPSPHNRDRSRSGDRSQSGNMGPPSQQVAEGNHNVRDRRQCSGSGPGVKKLQSCTKISGSRGEKSYTKPKQTEPVLWKRPSTHRISTTTVGERSEAGRKLSWLPW